MRHLPLFLLLLILSVCASAVEPRWLVAPAIAPDGLRVAFCYQGVLYVVDAKGGEARPLTTGNDYATLPIWSPKGDRLAYASDRYGNFDIYTIPAEGGQPVRITFGSQTDTPLCFTPGGDSVLYRSLEMPSASSGLFYARWTGGIYRVSANGGAADLQLPMPAGNACYAPDGKSILLEDLRGVENGLRKHHTSSTTRDIWLYTLATGKLERLMTRDGEDRNPVFAPGGQRFYFLSERDGGSFNVYEAPLANGADAKAITTYTKMPVRSLSASQSGVLCYTFDGQIYTQTPGQEAKVLKIEINRPNDQMDSVNRTLSSGAHGGVISPDGKEVAFENHGDIYVSNIEYGNTRRITNTPGMERSVSWAKDGRTLVYAGERGGSWNLYLAKIARDDENHFAIATEVLEEPLLVTDKETFQPLFSPDGKEVAFLEDRTKLKVINLASKQVRQLTDGRYNYSYSDGDIAYDWSPDSKWIALTYNPKHRWPNNEIGIVSANGGEIFNLTLSGYTDINPRWMMGGDMLIWSSDRNGLRSHASWGAQEDVYAFFTSQEAYDRYRLTPFEFEELGNGKKDKEDGEKKDDKKGKKDGKDKDEVKPIKLDFNHAEDRIVRLTIHSSDLSDAIVTPDGKSLYYLCSFEDKYNLWKTDLRKKTTSKVLDVNTSGGTITLDAKGENILISAGGSLVKVDLKGEKQKRVAYSAPFTYRGQAEREGMYDHAWRQVVKKFYRSDLHGADWDYYRNAYGKFLPYINNNYDFADLLSELLGELNASHTGSGYRHAGGPGAASTASLGVFFDRSYKGPGVRVTEVLRNGPLDKADSKVKPGSVITKINGLAVSNYGQLPLLLDQLAGKRIRIDVKNGGTETSEVVKPISSGQLSTLLYDRWVEQRRHEVDSLSHGRLGYVHIQAMNGSSFRTIYSDLFGRYNDREGVVIDTRYNGGGHLHEDVEVLFSGQKYLDQVPREHIVSEQPRKRWKKPSVMLVAEANYSNAHGTPWVYKTMGIGKLVGRPVPGTMTSVWWETLVDPTLYFGIPIVGYVDSTGHYLENQQLEPDYEVWMDYQRLERGHDSQLEKAVEVLLQEADRVKASSPWPKVEEKFLK
ncbi:MAG: S41 family peptidase [Bacteroides sp.]